eukprot:SAG11_NODE_890_length_6689_cov_18.947951_4_plen_150_part_00
MGTRQRGCEFGLGSNAEHRVRLECNATALRTHCARHPRPASLRAFQLICEFMFQGEMRAAQTTGVLLPRAATTQGSAVTSRSVTAKSRERLRATDPSSSFLVASSPRKPPLTPTAQLNTGLLLPDEGNEAAARSSSQPRKLTACGGGRS